MGALLGSPVTTKESGDGLSREAGLAWGYSSMQGWRNRMEDAHFCVPDLAVLGPETKGWRGTALFGVLDGHGGDQVALFCEQRLPPAIASGPAEDAPGALKAAFHRMDEMLADPVQLEEYGFLPKALAGLQTFPQHSGCTAVVCCVRRDAIVVANAGDSRAVLCRRGKAVDLSMDHKPNLPQELARIQRAGGCIVEQKTLGPTQYRVNGNLNLSRSIGDLGYKRQSHLPPEDQMICCTPDVHIFERQADDEFLVLACDGVWDVLSSQEVVDFIRRELETLHSDGARTTPASCGSEVREARLSLVLEGLLDRCLSPNLAQTSGLGGDNMTIIVVQFLRGEGSPQEPGWNSEDDRSELLVLNDGVVKPGSSWLCPYR